MEYPKRIMSTAEMSAYTGQRQRYFSELYYFPGQKFAFRRKNSPRSKIYIDTAEYEKWRMRQVKLSQRR